MFSSATTFLTWEIKIPFVFEGIKMLFSKANVYKGRLQQLKNYLRLELSAKKSEPVKV